MVYQGALSSNMLHIATWHQLGNLKIFEICSELRNRKWGPFNAVLLVARHAEAALLPPTFASFTCLDCDEWQAMRSISSCWQINLLNGKVLDMYQPAPCTEQAWTRCGEAEVLHHCGFVRKCGWLQQYFKTSHATKQTHAAWLQDQLSRCCYIDIEWYWW
jgi:hypothetical protein